MQGSMLTVDREEDVKNIGRVPGLAQMSASAIIAEIGDAKRFAKAKKMALWPRLCLFVYRTVGFALSARNISLQTQHGR